MLLTQGGCGVDPETLKSLQSAVSTVSNAESSPNSAELGDNGPIAESEIAFVPKYPERIDPFSFPSGQTASQQGNAPLATVTQIEVLGFANVGTAHVLLKSGDKSRSLKVGESIDGIRVLAINPPTTQLQAGTLVWTATMFDQSESSQ